MQNPIILRGCRQHNLKGFDLEIPRGKYVAISGVSGSGKSSLAIDTLYAEGQRRYIESFSAYARQFLERMDRPLVASVAGIPPAVAIAQGNNIRTSRSTVGTLTEINDYLKILFARLGLRHCDRCNQPVQRLTPAQIVDEWLNKTAKEQLLLIGFPGPIARQEDFANLCADLRKQGFIRAWSKGELSRLDAMQYPGAGQPWVIVLDRIQLQAAKHSRLVDALEQAFAHSHGKATIINEQGKLFSYDRDLRCANCNLIYTDPSPNQFSFNSPLGACPECRGFGRTIAIDRNLVIPDATRSIAEGAIKPWTTEKTSWEAEQLHQACRRKKISLHTPWQDLSEVDKEFLWHGEGKGFEEGKWFGIQGWFAWLETKVYKLHVRVLLSRYRVYLTCNTCQGTRLQKSSLQTRIAGMSIADFTALPLVQLQDIFQKLKLPKENKSTHGSVQVILQEIRSRLAYLCAVGLDYLSLGRASRTLSGGELQRVNLTTAVGSSLVNTLFVLDEPSVGLHARDNERLLQIFHRLRDRHNTVVVIEHDPAILAAADHLIDLGPQAGENGGAIVYQGSVANVRKEKRSATGQFLSGKIILQRKKKLDISLKNSLIIRQAQAHNLKKITVRFPFAGLTCVSGVSGSGKSTLMEDVLYRGIMRRMGEPIEEPGKCKEIVGWEQFGFISLVDQSALSRSPKSMIASFVGIHSRMQQLLASTTQARAARLPAAAFSTAGGKGRCPLCEGSGAEKIEMQFLSDIYLPCPECEGKRFQPEVLRVQYREKNILDIYDLTLAQALIFFHGEKIAEVLQNLADVGLGYLRLGQALNTLSGGEAQRVKLAMALWGKGKTSSQQRPEAGRYLGLFLLDEPTTGLHGADLPHLIRAFDKLLAAGHTLIVIEHNLQIIALADHVIDLGPEGGEAGGYLIAEGSPEQIAQNKKSITGRYLQNEFRKHYTGRRTPTQFTESKH